MNIEVMKLNTINSHAIYTKYHLLEWELAVYDWQENNTRNNPHIQAGVNYNKNGGKQ